MTFMGWDIDQWAEAIARLGISSNTIAGAIDLQAEWKKKYLQEPCEVSIIGCPTERDYQKAHDLIMASYSEAFITRKTG